MRRSSRTFAFPGGKRFAFTVVDDTDVATVENVRPVYDLLHRLGMRTTKTVWPLGCPEGSPNFSSSQTLEDEDYTRFVLELRERGFEITWHGPTMESSDRARVVRGLERYRDVLGEYPRIHVNHSFNADNVYWGEDRLDDPLLRRLTRFGQVASEYGGHKEGSPHWWGDLCAEHVEYARNLTFDEVNTSRVNPSTPYRDPARPLVPWWFSASDANSVTEFNELISPRNQERLEREGGFCIVATHFGKNFTSEGVLDATFRERMELLAARNGWFPTVGELLDWLRSQRHEDGLPPAEWRAMQWRWFMDVTGSRLRTFRRRIISRLKPSSR